jgi:hypothetical protein
VRRARRERPRELGLLEQTAVAICKSVYASKKCECEGSTARLAVCPTMMMAAAEAAKVVVQAIRDNPSLMED